MPDRVKCLHVLIAHSLAKGPGVNPFGDEALAMLAGEPAMAGIWTGGVDVSASRRAIDCGTNSIRLLIADFGRRAGCAMSIARCASCGWARVSTPQGEFAPEALARTGARADRLRRTVAAPRGFEGADGRDVGDPRRRQPRRVLRDDVRGARRRRARRGRRGDHRRRGGRAVVPRRGRRIGLRRSAFRRRRPRRRIHRGGAWGAARWRPATRPTSAACG